MATFLTMEVPTTDGPAIVGVHGSLFRTPGRGLPTGHGTIDDIDGAGLGSLVGKMLFAHVPAHEFVGEFPESAREAAGAEFARVPFFITVSHGLQATIRMAGAPSFIRDDASHEG